MRRSRKTTPDLRQTVVPHIESLTPALRHAADYILKNPNNVAMRSLRQVAEISGINPPTFTRLAQSLGFNGYEELRELCRQDVEQAVTSFSEKASALQDHTGTTPGALLSRHASASKANIDHLLQGLELAELDVTAVQLAKARNVALVGALSSASLIDYLGYMAQMAFPNWRTLLRNHETLSTALNGLGPKDIMIVLALKPYASTAIEAAERAHAAGIPVIAITDSYTAPIVPHASHTFVVPTDSPHFFASAVPLIVFFESLLSMVVRRSGKKTTKRIAEIERENHRSGDYWQS